MKSSAFISLLLLALVASKLENKFNPLTSMAKAMLAYSEDYGDDEKYKDDPCGNKTQSECTKTSAGQAMFQCCYVKAKIEKPEADNQEECTEMIKPFAPFSKLIKASNFLSFYREIYGFSLYGVSHDDEYDDDDQGRYAIANPEIKGDFEITCQDGSVKKSVDFGKFTDEEISMFESENYCLYDLYHSFENITIPTGLKSKNLKCETLSVLPSSKKDGLECAYLTVSFKREPFSFSVDSCILYNKDFYSKVEIPKEYLQYMNQYMEILGGGFSVEIHNANGNKFSFDSETGKIINKSSFASISKYLLVLLGLILM